MTDLSEIKSLIEGIGRAHEEYKRTNDERIAKMAKGESVAEHDEKLARIDEKLTMLTELKAHVDDIEKKVGRAVLNGAGDDQDFALEVKGFNDMRRARAKVATADIEADEYRAYKSAFWKSIRQGIDSLEYEERKALSAGSDPDGGYMLPVPTVGRIVTNIFESSPIRQIAAVQPISGDALEGIEDRGEVGSGWVAETGTRSDSTTPQVGKYRIEAHEQYSQPKATQKLLDDAAVNIEGWLAEKVSSKFARDEGTAFVSGNGVGRPKGFTSYTTAATADATRTWGQLEHVVTGVNGDFAATNPADILFTLEGAFKQPYLNGASFVTKREVITKVRKFKGSDNNYLWQPGLQAGKPATLIGYPIVMAEDMPALSSNGLSLALGDFKAGYQVVDRIGVRTLRDPFTDKPYVKFYSTRRVGGAVVDFHAIKFVKFST